MPGTRFAHLAPILVLALTSVAAAAPPPAQERQCLALAMYWEAKSEGRAGMVAVGWVVKNRVAHEAFPATICGVVYEGGETPPCQFSWWCDGRGDRPREADKWALARDVAARLLSDAPDDPTGGAVFFHSTDIGVPWTVERTRTARIGNHVYYR